MDDSKINKTKKFTNSLLWNNARTLGRITANNDNWRHKNWAIWHKSATFFAPFRYKLQGFSYCMLVLLAVWDEIVQQTTWKGKHEQAERDIFMNLRPSSRSWASWVYRQEQNSAEVMTKVHCCLHCRKHNVGGAYPKRIEENSKPLCRFNQQRNFPKNPLFYTCFLSLLFKICLISHFLICSIVIRLTCPLLNWERWDICEYLWSSRCCSWAANQQLCCGFSPGECIVCHWDMRENPLDHHDENIKHTISQWFPYERY